MLKKYVDKHQECMYVVLRVVAGLFFAIHGAQKFGIIGDGSIAKVAGAFGFPPFVAFLVAGAELLGGLAILTGFFTRLAAIGTAIVMIGANVLVHKLSFPVGPGGGELPILYLAIFLFMITKGNGMWSLERQLTGEEFF